MNSENALDKAIEDEIRNLEAKGMTREEIHAIVEEVRAEKDREASGGSEPSTPGGLEQELTAQLKVDEAELLKKASTMKGVNDPGDLLVWATGNVFGPVLKQHQDAILRLAREVDELKGNHGE